MMNKRIAIYPGTFDPITFGHEDIITRATRLCDVLYIAVATAYHKNTLLDIQTRAQLVRQVILNLDQPSCQIKVITFAGLLVEVCRNHHVQIIIRGLRNSLDYEYEKQLAQTNQHLASDIETVFIQSHAAQTHISSTVVRELAKLNAPLDGWVSPSVKKKLTGND